MAEMTMLESGGIYIGVEEGKAEGVGLLKSVKSSE
jgi:hypothetical protein